MKELDPLELYRRMLRIRRFEQAAEKNIKAGKISGACHVSIGQEAAIAGACMALRNDDSIFGTHRSHGHPIGKGADLNGLMAELMGKVDGICKGRGGSMHLADSSVGVLSESAIVGGGIPLATGAALSAQARGTDQVSLCFFGDGASNQGTFHESINMAAIWKLPVIFFCENNLYAAITPAALTHGQPDIAKRADGYGIPGVIVDGQDADAVYKATHTAVERARKGEGPTLIEAKTYRFDEHSVGLFFDGYRGQDEVDTYKSRRDPIALYRQSLISDGGEDEATLNAIEEEVDLAVANAVTFGLNSPEPDPADVYDYMFSDPIHYPPVNPSQHNRGEGQ